jgi:predicted RNase H-like HicB family nuclease
VKYTVILLPDPEGGFTALVPAMPGCVSEGDDLDESLANVRDAMRGWTDAAAAQSEAPLEETRPLVLDGVRQALEIMDDMRDSGDTPNDWPSDLRLTTVTLEPTAALLRG